MDTPQETNHEAYEKSGPGHEVTDPAELVQILGALANKGYKDMFAARKSTILLSDATVDTIIVSPEGDPRVDLTFINDADLKALRDYVYANPGCDLDVILIVAVDEGTPEVEQ